MVRSWGSAQELAFLLIQANPVAWSEARIKKTEPAVKSLAKWFHETA
jgi:hypothetical protein